MAGFDGKFDSAKQDWETPQPLFDAIAERFKFTLDLAASEDNTKCQNFFSEEDNALAMEWIGICWLNPPYGGSGKNSLKEWIKKAHSEAIKHQSVVVMLIPARTNTNWWHDYCMKASEIWLLRGRPKFGDAKHGLPQPMAIVIFRGMGSACRVKSFDIRGLT